MMRLFKS